MGFLRVDASGKARKLLGLDARILEQRVVADDAAPNGSSRALKPTLEDAYLAVLAAQRNGAVAGVAA